MAGETPTPQPADANTSNSSEPVDRLAKRVGHAFTDEQIADITATVLEAGQALDAKYFDPAVAAATGPDAEIRKDFAMSLEGHLLDAQGNRATDTEASYHDARERSGSAVLAERYEASKAPKISTDQLEAAVNVASEMAAADSSAQGAGKHLLDLLGSPEGVEEAIGELYAAKVADGDYKPNNIETQDGKMILSPLKFTEPAVSAGEAPVAPLAPEVPLPPSA